MSPAKIAELEAKLGRVAQLVEDAYGEGFRCGTGDDFPTKYWNLSDVKAELDELEKELSS